MKKVIFLILLLIVSYILSIFVFPSFSKYIWEKLWLTWFNTSVVKIRNDFNEYITSFDMKWKYNDTKEQALEIKQNVETQVNETKKQIEVIQTNVDKTAKAIDDTTKAINNVVKTSSDLTQSITNVIPKTWSGN